MTNWKVLVTIVLLAIVISINYIECRGGRGGGGRGGYRGGSRSGSRSSSGGSRGYSMPKWKSLAATGALFYGGRKYMTSSRYMKNPDMEPTICKNYLEANGKTIHKLFICPMPNQDENMDYCCGPESGQKCCTFWQDSGRLAGAVVGIVLAVLVVVGIITCVIGALVRHRRALA